ncbi:sodium channel protein Nach [Cryptotermes secundus]|uniref:sodium channel protein Nach n=1 Tax=Cryptotermes secundus TaxID=105785 RepID=UPI001454D6EB|nr:sodium channel protein Nach [Cryptotermes secundus]
MERLLECKLAGATAVPEEKLPQCHFTHHGLISNTGPRCVKPATNRLSLDRANGSVAITDKAMGRWGNHRRHNIQPHRTKHTGAQQSISLAIGRYTKEFFEDTTIQGLRYIVAANTHPLETLLWAAVTVLASVGAMFVVLRSWEHYVANPTVLSLEKDYRQWSTLFPAVTICFLQNLNHTRARQEIHKMWGNVDDHKMEYYLGFLNTLTNASLYNLHEFERYEKDTTLDKIGDLEDLATKVQNRLQQYDISLMDEETRVKLRPTLSELGLCFTWGSSITHLFAPRNASPPSPSEDLVTPCRYEDLPRGIHVSSLPTDLKLYVHSTDDMPLIPRSKPHWEFRGFEREVYVQHKQTVASPELRRLNPEQRRCLFRDEVKYHQVSSREPTLPFYTYNLCNMACRRRAASRVCGCIPFFYRTLGGGKVCDARGMACLSRFKSNLTENVQCSCYETCELTRYSVESDGAYPLISDYAVSELSVQFFVGIKTFTKTRLRRDVIYSFEDLLVSFGGTVSFFLGCSVLSGLEFAYYFTLRLGCKVWMRHHKKITTRRPAAVQQPSMRVTRSIAAFGTIKSANIPWAQ